MTSITVGASIDEMPGIMRQAVEAVPRATLIELLPDGALIGRRTTFALGSETTRFTFHRHKAGGTEIRAESTTTGVFGYGRLNGAVLETGRAVLDALTRLAAAPDA